MLPAARLPPCSESVLLTPQSAPSLVLQGAPEVRPPLTSFQGPGVEGPPEVTYAELNHCILTRKEVAPAPQRPGAPSADTTVYMELRSMETRPGLGPAPEAGMDRPRGEPPGSLGSAHRSPQLDAEDPSASPDVSSVTAHPSSSGMPSA